MNNNKSKRTFDLEEIEEQENNDKKQDERKITSGKTNQVDLIIDALDQLGYSFVYNDLSKEIELLDEDSGEPIIMDDYIFNHILVELWKNDVKIAEKKLQAIIMGGIADKYHPIKVYFDNLDKWDGEDHIQQLADTVMINDMGIGLQGKWLKFLKKWLVAATAQAIEPDKTNHACLTLLGGQGLGKSTWLNNLCPENLKHLLYVGPINSSQKDSYNLLAERFLVNIDDQLDQMKDTKPLKSLFTMGTVTIRKAYTRFMPTRPRICSFMASVNQTEFLTDTENRRYLVFYIDDIDMDAMEKVNIDKVWAQAKHLLDKGFRYWFNKEENAEISAINNEFRVKPIEEELLIQYFKPDLNGEPLMQTEVLERLQAKSNSKLSSNRLSVSLKKLGYQRRNVRRDGRSGRYCYMVSEIEPAEHEEAQRELKQQILDERDFEAAEKKDQEDSSF